MSLFGSIVIALLCLLYFLGMISYMAASAEYDMQFLSIRLRDDVTKVGFIVLIIVDIIMLPWVLLIALVSGITWLVKKIIFRG